MSESINHHDHGDEELPTAAELFVVPDLALPDDDDDENDTYDGAPTGVSSIFERQPSQADLIAERLEKITADDNGDSELTPGDQAADELGIIRPSELPRNHPAPKGFPAELLDADLTLLDAARHYLTGGIGVVPTNYPKHPGSILGTGWDTQVLHNPDDLPFYFRDADEDHTIGIMAVPGVGLAVIDVDIALADVPEPLREFLETCPYQASSTTIEGRGHYWAAITPELRAAIGTDNELHTGGHFEFDGISIGDWKHGFSAAVLVHPSVHPNLTNGRYQWKRAGEPPALPHALAARTNIIRPRTPGSSGRSGHRISHADLEAFYTVHAATDSTLTGRSATGVIRNQATQDHPNTYPAMLGALVNLIEEVINSTGKTAAIDARTAIQGFADAYGDIREDTTLNINHTPREHAIAKALDAVPWAITTAENNLATTPPTQPPAKIDDDEIPSSTTESTGKTTEASYTQVLSDVTPEKVNWLWWPHIPRGKVTIFDGEPDVGKSTMTLTWAAMVSNGGPWPASVVGGIESHNEKGLNEPADVILVGVEDGVADTVVPRLIAAGADRSRIHMMKQARDANGQPEPFTIPDDVINLRRAIEEVNAALVVIDPITAFLSDKIKTGVDTSVRKALMTLADVAAQTGAAIVMVRHLNKSTGESAKNRGGGSVAFGGLARSGLIAAKLNDDDRANTTARYGLARAKGNLAPSDTATLGYTVISSPADPDSPVIIWAGTLDPSRCFRRVRLKGE